MMPTTSLLLAVALLGASLSMVGTDDPVKPHKASASAVKRWQDWRFGMFVHWGPVSLTEKEISWSRANTNPECPNQGPTPAEVYDHLYERFNPTRFDADAWVRLAKEAGMRYIVLTAKHCDGFLLWHSKVDAYNIANTPFKRDVCAELASAAHKAGIGIGWYFSPMDWRDPDCRSKNNDRFVKRMQDELTELLTHYGKIDILWFDTDGRKAPWHQDKTYALVRKLQPDIVIDERLDLGDQGGWNEGVIGPWSDFHTPEQVVGKYDPRPWESCMTVSKSGQWSWGGLNDGVKTFEQCRDMLLGCAGGNGNMLLDVGPTATGEIADVQASLLRQIGGWLKTNGEMIYGTRGGPYKPNETFVSTHKGNKVFLYLLKPPEDGRLILPNLTAQVRECRTLAGQRLKVVATDGQTTVLLPTNVDSNRIAVLTLDHPVTVSPG